MKVEDIIKEYDRKTHDVSAAYYLYINNRGTEEKYDECNKLLKEFLDKEVKLVKKKSD